NTPASRVLIDSATRMTREADSRVRFVRLDDVDEMMRHGRAHGRARIRGADVHAAVDERRVHADDLERHVRREIERELGLAASRRARQTDAAYDAGRHALTGRAGTADRDRRA